MTEFKVGDKVRIKTDCSGSVKGQIYELYYDAEYKNIRTNIGSIEDKKRGCSCTNNWELVTTTFKKGDFVKRKDNGYIDSNGDKITEIINVDNNGTIHFNHNSSYSKEYAQETLELANVITELQKVKENIKGWRTINDNVCFTPEEFASKIQNAKQNETILFDEVNLISKMKMEMNNMELDEIKKENLKEAKKQVETERANAEVEYAKKTLKFSLDQIDMFDREINKLNEQKKVHLDIVKKFKKEA